MEPFRLIPVTDAPRPGPTMVQIAEKLVKLDQIFDMVSQVYKRQQQVALMVDGFGSNLTRRINDVQTECALLRATQTPGDEAPLSVASKTRAQKARAAIVLTGKVGMYATTAAVLLRVVGKSFPEYQEAIDAFLGVFGL